MSALPSIRTERLDILLLQPGLVALAAEYASSTREHLQPWCPSRTAAYFTLEHWTDAAERSVRDWQAGTSARFLLLPRDETCGDVIGDCSLTEITRGVFESCNLAYSLHPSALGKGFMSEALSAVVRFAFDSLRLHRIAANFMPSNVRSERVLKRVGFLREGYARDYLYINGAWEDHILTSIRNPNPEFRPASHTGV